MKQQSRVLKNIYEKFLVGFVPPQTNDIAVFIEHIASSLQNNNASKLSKCSELLNSLKANCSRNEFGQEPFYLCY